MTSRNWKLARPPPLPHTTHTRSFRAFMPFLPKVNILFAIFFDCRKISYYVHITQIGKKNNKSKATLENGMKSSNSR
jgi:hypothetical protein